VRVYRATTWAAGEDRPDRESFYDLAYRPALRRMIARVIAEEGPIFDDLLVTRIARAHGFGRAAGRIRETVLSLIDSQTQTSMESDRRIFWPKDTAPGKRFPFRAGALDDRNHGDIPLPELSDLAAQFVANGALPEEAAVAMSRHLGLSRLREATRIRFEEAARVVWQELNALDS
jgi:hypothetical protein